MKDVIALDLIADELVQMDEGDGKPSAADFVERVTEIISETGRNTSAAGGDDE